MTRLFVVAVALTLLFAAASPASAQKTDLRRPVTIDVTNASPQYVFDLLAKVLECKIRVHPALTTPITLRMVDARINDILPVISKLIDCEWTFDGKDISVRPMPKSRKRSQRAWDEHLKKLESRLPAGMRFDGVTLKNALDAIGKASGLKLRPWKGEADYKVTIDVGGKTVNLALEAIIAQIPNAEGVVMIRTPNGGMGQYRVLDKRRTL